MINGKLVEFQKMITYNFNDELLLKKALTHTSHANERKTKKNFHNERLEFLGDAVLELVTSQFLYFNYKKLSEGQLTKYRAKIVCEPTLAYVARSINLGKYLYLGKGEDITGGRDRDSILSDALEAVIGAIFLDSGYEDAQKFIKKYILDNVDKVDFYNMFIDYKTKLQEIIQSRSNQPLKYIIAKEDGPSHDKVFMTEVLHKKKVIGKGEGKNKKTAEQNAAKDAIKNLGITE